MITGNLDPMWDLPQFERNWLDRPATLRQMVTWAYHIHRSSPANYPALTKIPGPKETAARLWKAYQNTLPVEQQLRLAHDFNKAMLELQLWLAKPKPEKPTVGKAKDRLGEKQRRAEAKAAERIAKKKLKDSPVPTAYPVGSLFDGVAS